MDASRARLGHLRRDPRVSLTVLDKDSWYSHVSLAGVVERLVDDPDLADTDPPPRSGTRVTSSGTGRASESAPGCASSAGTVGTETLR